MALSKTAILNLALGHLGTRTTVQNIDTEASVEAKQGKLFYDQAREQALVDFDWTFARRRLLLAAHGNAAPTTQWAFRYQYPSDCLIVRKIVNPAGEDKTRSPYQIELADNDTVSIVTDVDDAELIYTSNVETVTLFTPHFTLALSYLLAHYLAAPLTRKQTMIEKMLITYERTIKLAGAHDGNQEAARPEPDALWIQDR